MKTALITCTSLGEYVNNVESEDDLLCHFLRTKGLDVQFEVWTDPQVNWSQYNWLLIKSPWDYFDRIDEFYAWLSRIEQGSARMLNPAAVIRWNADKTYLREIADVGLPIIPTRWIEKGQSFDADHLFNSLQTDHLIIKPRISGGAKKTFAIRREEAERHIQPLTKLFGYETFMAQPFMKEIQTQGEWSFIFFNGRYSHCVLKTAKAGDFRVQHYLGGTIHSLEAPPHLLSQAKKVVENFATGCLYARVDGLEIKGELWLMELELLEPFLFLFTHPEALENYFEAFTQIASGAN
jgi:glutathione synthase/RimK-type ligase-like ATP-grasp enzyme